MSPTRAEFLASAGALGVAQLTPTAPAAPAPGLMFVEHLTSAPFPHASRAAGHTYQNTFYDAAAHYSDSSVGVFVPNGYVPRDDVDLIVHFHGWNNSVAGVFQRYKIAEQLAATNVNAILVVPQGPLNAPDSGDGKLELDENGFARFVADVIASLRARGAIHTSRPGRIALTAHSGGYGGLGGVLTRGGMNGRISDVILFDAAYGYFDAVANWAKSAPHHRLLSLFTDDTSTGNAALMAMLQGPAPNLYVRLASQMTLENMRVHAPTFVLTTGVAHDELLQKFSWYGLFLQTTALNRR
ncbi:MAG: hypothetical protein ABR508_03155 [Candidatus Baltobacteraceae bacterium]